MFNALVVDAVTRTVRDELPWESLSFTRKLNDKGSWKMTLPLSYEVEGFEKLGTAAFEPARSLIIIQNDGVPLFPGWINQEGASISEDKDSLVIGGPDAVQGYLELCTLIDPDGFVSYLNTDQFVIIDDLVEWYAGDADYAGFNNADHVGIGINMNRIPTNSGVPRTRTWYNREGNNIMKLVQDMSKVINGFDFCTDVAGSATQGFNLLLTVGYPQLRRETGFVLHLGKNIKTFDRTTDATKVANRGINIRGQGDQATWVLDRSDFETVGVRPTMDVVKRVEGTKTTELEMGDELTRYFELNTLPQEFLKLNVDPDDDECRLGTFREGDEFRVIVHRGRVQIDDYYRVNEFSVSVDADGKTTMNMTMTGAEVTS